MGQNLPNFLAKSLMAEISEKVQPPRNITSLHFDPPGLVSFKLESEEKKREGKIIYNDLEVAHRHGDFRLPFLVELKLQNVGFWGEEEIGETGEKPLGTRERTNNKLNPHKVSTPGFWTRAKLMGGECSHHCARLKTLKLFYKCYYWLLHAHCTEAVSLCNGERAKKSESS